MRDFIYLGTPGERTRAILADTARDHAVSVSDIEALRIRGRVVIARQDAMWRLKHYTKLSYPQIGRLLGGRHHTTIMHGVKAHAARIAG